MQRNGRRFAAVRTGAAVAGMAAGIAVAALGGCERGVPPRAAQTGQTGAVHAAGSLAVARGALDDRIALTGELEAVQSDNLLVPRTDQWLLSLRWLADDGVQVKKGDKLVEFDSTSSERDIDDKTSALLRRENELTAEIAAAAQALAEKSMDVERKRAELEKAGIEASVPQDLYPRREYQERQLRLLQSRDALQKAEAELATRRKTAELEQTVKEVAKSRAQRELAELQRRLSDLTLRAPRDGLLQVAIKWGDNRKYLAGDSAPAGSVVAALPDLSKLQVRARLSDVDDGGVRVGMAAECVLDAYPDRVLRGTVRELSPVARPEGREATRSYFDVVVALDAVGDAALRERMYPGLSVRIEVIRRHTSDALLIPRAAIRGRGESAQVHIAAGGTPGGSAHKVSIDFCSELWCAISQPGALQEGTPLLPATLPSTGAP